ncbi:rod shape-determining protein MreC [Desulfobulbus alkaliphilus]|uniref:rod shape-determining protein MreC n=1 Tax=Desulfobulbus alkaliphilus TaxID=869814 RepID=UPI0019659315|nr:rod shape-determining protein MreC [Desulfobulbus alkaliphilus]MBM9535971.1 rod shape-determining protein MreC [Desulfobulbus alkaliphilus]
MRKKTIRKRSSRFRLFRIVFLAGFLLTVTLIFLVSTLGTQKFGAMHKLVLEAVGPLQKMVTFTTSSVKNFVDDHLVVFQDSLRLREENNRLLIQLQEKEELLNKSREAMATNASFRRLLGFRDGLSRPAIAASVIGKDPSVWFRSIIIDQGSNSGIVKGNPVVNSEGVVGQVFTTSPNYSKVLLAIAPSSAIDVLLQKSRVRGILKGTGTLTYRLEYILKTVEVEEGDYVVTAGYGGVFPTGLPVGVVSRVIKKPRGMFHEIEVTPTVDYQTLEHLLVIEQRDISELQQMDAF